MKKALYQSSCLCRTLFSKMALTSVVLAFAVLLAVSCGDEEGPTEITEERVVTTPVAPVQQVGALPAGHPDIGTPQLPEGHPEIDPSVVMTRQPASFAAAVTGWEAPESWTKAPHRPMRVVTFTMGGDKPAECYVTTLSGAAGGVEANTNRWRGQLGQLPLDEEGVAGLQTVSMLGKEAVLVEVYTSSTGEDQDGRGLLGVICELEDQVVFVKMVGPQATVRAEKERFVAFCESLK